MKVNDSLHSGPKSGPKRRGSPHRAFPSAKRALDDAIRSASLRDEHAALLALAKRLAVELDSIDGDPEMVAKVAARYLPVLDALGLTVSKAGLADGGGRADVSDFRERRSRLRSAASVDGTAS